MKKVILTVVIAAIGFVGFSQESKSVTAVPSRPLDLRITDDMNNDDLRTEFTNNFFKIEMSDIRIEESAASQKNNDFLKDADKGNASTHQLIISDIAIRTTEEMRGSLQSIAEIVA
ncbi:MAG TPA: hypothetical protein ENK46_11270 [Flavobacteriia bacterium]|nr:hypothetical protein [Flavobacteriia bacterium]